MAAGKDDRESEQGQPSAFKNLVSGGVGGACVVLVGHPLDTIKVLRIRPYQFDVLFHEYGDSLFFCQNDL